MAIKPPERTHTAWAFSRQGKKHGKLLEVGTGYIDPITNIACVIMDRAPIQGYTGFVTLTPKNGPPPVAAPPPEMDEEEGQGEDEAPEL
jgi:hypothetical protein